MGLSDITGNNIRNVIPNQGEVGGPNYSTAMVEKTLIPLR
jgi:hypothetical protein